MRIIAPIEARTSVASGERNWDFQVLSVGGSISSFSCSGGSVSEALSIGSSVEEAVVVLMGDEARGLTGEDGSPSTGRTLDADGELELAGSGSSVIDPPAVVSAVDELNRDWPFGAETGGSWSHQIPTLRS